MSSYIGHSPQQGVDIPVDTFTSSGGSTYTLSRTPATVRAIQVSVTGILQDPSSYSLSGGTLTMAGVDSGDKIVVRHFGELMTFPTIPDDIVTSFKISSEAVETAKIKDANVTTAKIADGAITAAKIADGTVVAAELASDAVTTVKILDANVTTAKIADGAITAAKIADGTVVAAEIASNAVTTVKILDANVTTAKIAADAITGALIADDSIDSEHIADGSVDNAHLASGIAKVKVSMPVVTAVGGGATGALNLSLGEYFTKTITEATTISFTNIPTGFAGAVLEITNGGSSTVTWPAAVKWTGGTAPTLTTSGVDVLVFTTDDTGTTIRGASFSLDSK